MAAVAALDRGRTERQRRAQHLTAIERGDAGEIVSALITAEGQARKVLAVEERLARTALKAERGGIPRDVALVAGQELRAVEVAARLFGIGSYATQREVQTTPAERFSITINLGTSSTTIATTAKVADRRDDGDDWERP
jgi:hypothetical protein